MPLGDNPGSQATVHTAQILKHKYCYVSVRSVTTYSRNISYMYIYIAELMTECFDRFASGASIQSSLMISCRMPCLRRLQDRA